MVSQRSVTPEALGAWVIKCNPGKTALEPMCAVGEAHPSWCVADNYRSRLMRPGQRVLFWVAAHPQRGIWGVGRIVGEPAVENGRLRVPVRIPLLARPLTAARLSALPKARSMEVFRSPQQANPSWVSTAEQALIDSLLPTSGQG